MANDMLSYRLACELKGRIAAVASVAGSLPPEIARNCDAAGPISVLYVHGTADRIVPWSGGETASGGKTLSVNATIEHWVKADQCRRSRRNPKKGTSRLRVLPSLYGRRGGELVPR